MMNIGDTVAYTEKHLFGGLTVFNIVWSPVNQAFLILFGTGPMPTRTVLAVCATRNDAEWRLSQWGAR